MIQPTACQRSPLEMINAPDYDGQSQRGSCSVNSPVKERGVGVGGTSTQHNTPHVVLREM